jgi:hypothetical protein
VRSVSATNVTERYDLETPGWIEMDSWWLLEKQRDGDAFLDQISQSKADRLIKQAKITGTFPSIV